MPTTIQCISSKEQTKVIHAFLQKPDEVSKKQKEKYKIELASVQHYRQLSLEMNFVFQYISVEDFVSHPTTDTINLPFEAAIEEYLYSPYHPAILPVDGAALHRTLNDKYDVYRTLSSRCQGVILPKTIAIYGHADILRALGEITTPYIVIKPRVSYESKNVLILRRDRLSSLQPHKQLNFFGCVMQEYIEHVAWPPRELRFHFVGKTLCQVLEVIDKNNWAKAMRSKNIGLDNISKHTKKIAESVAVTLIGSRAIQDNMTLDFLYAKDETLIFLEANVGTLGSIFALSKEEIPFIKPIFAEMIVQKNKK